MRALLRKLPSPLRGGVGGRGLHDPTPLAPYQRFRSLLRPEPPTPCPSPQGGGES